MFLGHYSDEMLRRWIGNCAASRVFSWSTVDFIHKVNLEQVGLSIYLFVSGEMVDAWQNQSIGHTEIAQMVLHACFFLMGW
jgi:hypothetical protein